MSPLGGGSRKRVRTSGDFKYDRRSSFFLANILLGNRRRDCLLALIFNPRMAPHQILQEEKGIQKQWGNGLFARWLWLVMAKLDH
jgi:hypothetical protein